MKRLLASLLWLAPSSHFSGNGTNSALEPSRCPRSSGPRSKGGMTIIEVLIATAMTLLIMLALAQGFKTLSAGVTAGRARLTHSDQLRSLSSLLRSDLNGLTVNTNTLPQTTQFGSGYFMVYDGPISDATAMLFNYLPSAGTQEEKISASRWSDIDDAILFTAKAKEGEWFRGRMPLALLKIHQLNLGQSISSITESDWLTDVAIASEYAEIAWFMRPLNRVGSIDINEKEVDSYDVRKLPVNSVVDEVPVMDCRNADGSPGQDGLPDPDGMPDRIALCRKVLLIRPDLNITPPSKMAILNDERLTVRPLSLNTNNTDSFRYQMRFAYQRMDLSVRPAYDPVRGGFVLKTNTLGDLQLPENRFAHFVMPTTTNFNVGGSSIASGPAATLPVLALTPEVPGPLNLHYVRMTNLAYGNLFQPSTTPKPADLTYGTLQPADRGFIPAAFFRTTLARDSNNNLVSTPTLEEIVATNVVGFDVRGFDASAQLLASPGADGAWGIAGYSDDNGPDDNGTDDPNEAGWAGTDDLIVGPSDPGYALMLRKMEAPFSNGLVVASSGAFVDLGWGRKVVNQIENAGMTHTLTGTDAGMTHFSKDWSSLISRQASLWSSSLSGFEPILSGTPALTTTSLAKSGRFSPANGIYQPVFDTFTDFYESDGNRQEFGVSANGLIPYTLQASNSNPAPDIGSNGLDDPVNGAAIGNGVIDDEFESETSPPFRYRLPSIQVKFRIQDVTAGTLQELSIVHDLTSTGN